MKLRSSIPLAVLAMLLAQGGVCAQPIEHDEQQDPAGVGADPLPSLDELLGLQEPTAAHTDPNDEALSEVLSPSQAGEALGQAVGLMDRVARRIDAQHDLSISTQRIQEDILAKLDQVIESAKNNQQGGGGSSSSSSSSNSQQQPDQQQSENDQSSGQPSSSPGQESLPPGTSDAQPGGEIPLSGAAWGALPQRIRDALSQGINDQYSDVYRAITERYYRALAEDED